MGIGIGGDYPLSAVISSEFASSHIRGRMLTAVFANQGWGQFCERSQFSIPDPETLNISAVASLVGFLILLGFKNSFHDLSATLPDSSVNEAIDRTWRLMLGLGSCFGKSSYITTRLR